MSWLTRNRMLGLLLAAAIFVADQFVKWLMVGPLALREREAIHLLPFFDLRWTQNFGVSLGMFTASSMEMRWMLVAVTALIALAVFVWMMREKAMGEIAALALILGGALGNIRDRFLLGYVIDYVLFYTETWSFAVFNLADSFITIGAGLVILDELLLLRRRDR